jgi:hypothetical protein
LVAPTRARAKKVVTAMGFRMRPGDPDGIG